MAGRVHAEEFLVRRCGRDFQGAFREEPPARGGRGTLGRPSCVPLLHPYLDALNAGRNLRGQLTCFLASTGVGKSHIAKWIGVRADIDDGLHVLHFQLEGSEEEALNAYSGGLISRNAYYYERGKISDTEMRHLEKLVASYAGSITVRSYPRFNAQVSTLDIKNGISEYRKLKGYNPDIVIVDSMDLLTDANRRSWGADHERAKRIAVANDLKDLAADERYGWW